MIESDNLKKELMTRNVSGLIMASELEHLLNAAKPLTVYLGVDPSSPEIHLGHAVVLWKLRQFQDLGHHVILLIGDFTAQIGDPTGKSKERIPLTHEQVLEHARTYQEQASKILRFSGQNPAVLKFNSEWLAKLTVTELIHLASQFTVQQMIERDMFQERIKVGQPISLHEFLYPILVGYDSVELDVDVEVGGNDQLFNIKAGRTLMERLKGKKKVVLTCDLLTGSDGGKMSKSADNIIALTSTPEEMFGQLMSISDKLIEQYATLASDMSEHELNELTKRLAKGENPRDIKLDMAERIVARYSSADVAADARENFMVIFSKRTGYHGVPPVDSFFPVPVPSLPLLELVALIASESHSEARRLILGKAVDIDGLVQTDPTLAVDMKEAHVMKIGKHRFVRMQYLPAENK